MEAKATVKSVRCTPRKINQVLSLIRNKKVDIAFKILSFLPKAAACQVKKVLKSAVANSGKLKDFSNLVVKEAWVGNGKILKKVRFGSRQRASIIKKRTSNFTIIVSD
ncbi:MAG: 50S ribosomal protein L22 [Endomicrobium sp.]|jgi:large subunit ribosomal protein L22|nr:50S ribosomal protein L22 [Endomicrobium sp.]